MPTITHEQAAIASKQAIEAILAGVAPPSADYGPYAPVITQLSKKLASDGAEAARILYNVLLLNNKQLAALMKTEQGAEAAESADQLSSYPSLPPEARIDPALGADACRTLDAYIAHSRRWAPEAFEEAHEICFLWLASTVAARRVYIPFGPGGQYTNLMLALVARTTLHTKSTAASLAKDVLRSIGLGYLLGPDRTTPEKMLSDMAGRFDLTDYEKWSPEDKEYIQRRIAFSGQRAWYAEEFGMHLRAMLQDSGPYAAFHGLLRIADDCPDEYTASTVGRGEVRVEKPYLSVLASMTPADLRKGGKQGDEVWRDGTFARFGFGAPSEIKEGEFPEEEYSIPDAIRQPLKRWHESLGIPEVDIAPVLDEKTGKPTGQYQVTRDTLPRQCCQIDRDVREALYRYRRALRRMVAESTQEDTDGNYGRFSTLALRIAALFASLENGGHIQMRHWARAQTITERMRASLHRLIGKVNEAPAAPSYTRKSENKIVETIQKLAHMGKKATLRNIYTYGNMSAAEAKQQAQSLVDIGLLETVKDGRADVYRIAMQEAASTG